MPEPPEQQPQPREIDVELESQKTRRLRWRTKLRPALTAAGVLLGLRVGFWFLKAAGRKLRGGAGQQERETRASLQLAVAGQQTDFEQVPPAAHWRRLDVDPPPFPPPEYKPMASANLPCTVYEFYHHVLSNQTPYMQQQHEQARLRQGGGHGTQVGGQYNFVRRGWLPVSLDGACHPYPDDQSLLETRGRSVFDWVLGSSSCSGSFARTLTFTSPKKPPQTTEAHCVQRQQFAVFSGGVLVMATAMNMLNIPFKEAFTVNTAWEVRPSPDGGCTCTIFAKVHFIRSVLVGGIIRATTYRDVASFYKGMMDNTKTFLAARPSVQEPQPDVGGAGRNWGLMRALSINRGQPRAGQMLPSAGAGVPGSEGKGRQLLAHTVPLTRQLRVMIVMLVLGASVLHQLILHQELRDVIAHLKH